MIAIRPATPADLPALIALDTIAADHPERREAIVSWIADGVCLVAEHEGRVVGYAVLTHGFFHRPFVEMLMVAATARRAGIGQALLLHCAETAGAELWTSTNQSNAPMRALLARCGFVESGTIENLDPGDPELIFVLLSPSAPADPHA
jgi:ribosomal protein S18 acetylase RimI-like enzyme